MDLNLTTTIPNPYTYVLSAGNSVQINGTQYIPLKKSDIIITRSHIVTYLCILCLGTLLCGILVGINIGAERLFSLYLVSHNKKQASMQKTRKAKFRWRARMRNWNVHQDMAAEAGRRRAERRELRNENRERERERDVEAGERRWPFILRGGSGGMGRGVDTGAGNMGR